MLTQDWFTMHIDGGTIAEAQPVQTQGRRRGVRAGVFGESVLSPSGLGKKKRSALTNERNRALYHGE